MREAGDDEGEREELISIPPDGGFERKAGLGGLRVGPADPYQLKLINTRHHRKYSQ